MRSRSPHKVILGLLGLIAVMTLSSGCAPEQLQRFRETTDVALDTTKKAMETAEQGARTAECIKDRAACPAKHN
jgi:hypothetical protein